MKKTKLFVVASLLATSLVTVAGCFGDNGEDEGSSTKTKIYVNNLTAGFGSEWITKLKTRFEAAHANDSYEEGKMGVDIVVTEASQRATYMINNILPGRDEIYFTEQCSMFELFNKGICLDITDAVTEKLEGETKSIEDKMPSQVKDTFGLKDATTGATKYYSFPSYSGYFGITFDKDLFDKKNFYFAKTPVGTSLEGKFVTKTNNVKSDGPDGVSGTFDDGLPVTYDDFFELCDFMVAKQCTPISHNGKNGPDYLNGLMEALATDYEGIDEYQVQYHGAGDLNDLISVTSDGVVTQLPKMTVQPSNAYNTTKMAGKYYAIKFLERLLSNEDYYSSKLMSKGYTVGDCQDDFLRSKVQPNVKPVAMMADGSWWINEAKTSFQMIADYYGEEGNSQMSHNLAFMPFPKATAERAAKNRKNTFNDWLTSYGFIKSNAPTWKIPLLKEFIKFANTDVSLIEFTETTNIGKTLEYEMPETSFTKMPYYAKCLYELKNKSDILYPASSTKFYQNNGNNYHHMQTWYSTVGGVDCQYVLNGLTDSTKKWTAEQYFNGMFDYYSGKWTTIRVL